METAPAMQRHIDPTPSEENVPIRERGPDPPANGKQDINLKQSSELPMTTFAECQTSAVH